MKKIYFIKGALMMTVFATLLASGCKKLAFQSSFSRSITDTIDAHLYKTAWQYMASRSKGTDTTFKTFRDGIIYSGIDTTLYSQPNHTYFFLSAAGCKDMWAKIKVNGKAATSFNSYSKADLKNYFLYLIVQGQYSHYNLPINPVTVQTLAPPGTYTSNSPTFTIPLALGIPAGSPVPSNPNSTMTLYVLNNSIGNTLSYPIVVNMSIATTATLSSATSGNNVLVITSDLLATNGVVDVMNGAAWPVSY